MVLFLVFLIPTVIGILLINFFQEGNVPVLPITSFLMGIVLFFPGIFICGFIMNLFDPSYTAFGFYLHSLLKDHLLYLLTAVGWLFLLRNTALRGKNEHLFRKILAFLGGYYSSIAVYEYLENIAHLDFYALFLLPVLQLTMVLAAATCIALFVTQFGFMKYFSLLGLVGLPFILNINTVLFLRNYPVIAGLGTIILLSGAVFLFFRFKDY